MTSKKRPPPSKVKYDAAHPTVSVRLTPNLRTILDRLRQREGLSFAGAIRALAEREAAAARLRDAACRQAFERGRTAGLQEGRAAGRAEGHAAGHAEGVREGYELFRFKRLLLCPRCGAPLDFNPADPWHRHQLARQSPHGCAHPPGQ